MAAWRADLDEAQSLNKAAKYFDAVQKANSCMELFEKELGKSDSLILKEPITFVKEVDKDLTTEQRASLKRMYEVRGDILTGLGATKRAATEYSCAQLLDPDDAGVQAKKASVETSALKPDDDKKVPVSVLTGFLGSGKTTLLNHILQSNHGKRIAVIENEFGEVGIDDALVKGGSMAEEENIVEMNNGCICCTVRGDLIAGLKKLIKNAKKQSKPLDGVLIETTGLADPAPVAQTFFADDFVQQHMRLDGILTLVDAKHIVQHLEDEKPEGVENEAVEQIAFADRILLNKCDLVDSEDDLVDVEKRIRAINAGVPIKRTTNSEIDMDFILGIRAFSLDKIVESDDKFLEDSHEHSHDSRVSSIGIDVVGEVVQQKLNEWIGWLLKEKGVDLFRSKGVLAVKGMKQKFVFQAIHMLFANSQEGEWLPDEEKRCKVVFIGKNLDRNELTEGFMKCMAK
nr:CobW domain-containing protein 4 [Karlodinium veneficum]